MASFSVCLQDTCANELTLLRTFDAHTELFDEHVLLNAIYRYENHWLPMQAANKNPNTVPPLDVHLVQHAHMLRPHAYQRDCLLITGHIVDHKIHSSEDSDTLLEASMDKWKMYHPEEPYAWRESLTVAKGKTAYEQKSRYDVVAAVYRQQRFTKKIIALNLTFEDLNDAVEKYQKFLTLITAYPEESLNPSLIIDLIWHTHQLHPVAYAADCHALVGKMIGHNDEAGGIDNSTERLWLTFYGEPMAVDAGGSGKCKSKCHGESPAPVCITQYCNGHCNSYIDNRDVIVASEWHSQGF